MTQLNDLKISQLTDITTDELARIGCGYVSNQKYQINRIQQENNYRFFLDLKPLDSPYKKTFTYNDDQIEYYRSVIAKGYSYKVVYQSRILAFAIAEPESWNRTMWVWEFHVDPGYRGQGLGHRLMEKIIRVSSDADMRVVLCETQNTNVPAINFYSKMGFELDAFDLSYYTNADVVNGEIAMFMKYKIQPSNQS